MASVVASNEHSKELCGSDGNEAASGIFCVSAEQSSTRPAVYSHGNLCLSVSANYKIHPQCMLCHDTKDQSKTPHCDSAQNDFFKESLSLAKACRFKECSFESPSDKVSDATYR